MNKREKDSIEALEEYVQSHTTDEILMNGLMHFYEADKDISFNELADRFNSEKFNELGEKLCYFRDNVEEIKRNFEKFKKVYNNLNEEKSKKVFLNMLCAKTYMDLSYVRASYDTEDIYFDFSIWGQLTDEVYVDCGGYIGDTALSFISHCPDYKSIYVLEPLEEIKQLCEDNLKFYINEGNTKVINCAAYDKETLLKFTKNNGTGDSCIEENGKIEILSTSLDIAIKEPISFIKMDIEGAEKKALIGAMHHIQADSPKMAICVYHLSDDFWKIPELILEMNSNYDFIFRQHRPDVFSETVIYAVPKQPRTIYKREYDIDLKYYRLLNALKQVRRMSPEEHDNLMNNIKDKAWYLYQIRMHNNELQKLSDDIEIQHNTSVSLLTSHKSWIDELQKGKDYLEKQLENYKIETDRLNSILADEKAWTVQLQEGKDYLEDTLSKVQLELENSKKQIMELEIRESELNNELSKSKYKLSKLLNDSLIKRIIKIRKIEI